MSLREDQSSEQITEEQRKNRETEERERIAQEQANKLLEENERIKKEIAKLRLQQEEQLTQIPILPSIDDCRVDRKSVIHTELNENRCTISFDPVISSGIARFEAVFKNHEKIYFDIGVANATVRFDRNSRSSREKGQSVYLNSGTGNMENLINNHEVSGNAAFECGQRVAAEVDMNLHTLHFFVDDVEQPNYVVNIPPAIRFFAFLWQEGSSFEVTQFIRRSSPSSTNLITGSRSWEWGKEWTVEKVKQLRIRPTNPIIPQFSDIQPPPFIIPPGLHPIIQNSPSPPPRSPCTIPRTPSPEFEFQFDEHQYNFPHIPQLPQPHHQTGFPQFNPITFQFPHPPQVQQQLQPPQVQQQRQNIPFHHMHQMRVV